MGEIIFWGIIRTGLLILALWFSFDFIDYKFWWSAAIISIYVIIIHPAIIQMQLFKEKNKRILTDTLCSRCKHFDETAILCTKYDQHPTAHYVPCDGVDWEPKY
jgi:glucan phosphoethanolaminetransferase (alkaline phosphatase superfamily)